jgi:hypothetical protein
MIRQLLELLDNGLRLIIAFVLLWAGVAKLVRPDAFRKTIGDFGLVFDAFVPAVAVVLPIVEIIVATLLLLDLRGGRFAGLVLSLVFVGVTGYGLWLGLDIECGCFGPGDDLAVGGDLRLALVRSMVMTVVCAYLWAWPRRACLAARG